MRIFVTKFWNRVKGGKSFSIGINSLSTLSKKQKYQAFGVGIFAGTFGSLVGMGGAFIALPFLTGPMKISQNHAHGTSIAAVLLTAIGGTASYAHSNMYSNDSFNTERKILVDNFAAICIASTSSMTAIIGAKISKKLPSNYLKASMGIFMILVSPIAPLRDFLISKKNWCSQPTFDSELLSFLGIGCISGFLSGIFGVGGGAVIVPALCLLGNMDYKTALGTSLMSMIPMAISASITHYRQGTMLFPIAWPLGVGCLLGSFLGGQIGGFSNEYFLKYGFAAIMIVLGSKSLISLVIR